MPMPTGKDVASTNRTPCGPSDMVNPGMGGVELSGVVQNVLRWIWAIFSDQDSWSICCWIRISSGFSSVADAVAQACPKVDRRMSMSPTSTRPSPSWSGQSDVDPANWQEPSSHWAAAMKFDAAA